MKLGLIARDDNRGLGIQSWEFYQHFNIIKTLVIDLPNEHHFPERYPDARFRKEIKKEDIDWLLDGIDVLISFETFYSKDILREAKKRKIKTILQINYEWYEGERPDLIIAPSLWHYDKLPEPKVYLPVPVNRELLPFKVRKRAKVFLHNVGNDKAGYDRNGTDIVLKAIPLVKSDVQFIIKSQVPIKKIEDRRVQYIAQDVENYWESWPEADVLIYPRRYGGLSLQLNEAMSLGIPVIMTDMYPQNEFLPKELLVKPKKILGIHIKQHIEIASINPKDLAERIDEVAHRNIRKYSEKSNQITEYWSWESLRPKYICNFQKLETT